MEQNAARRRVYIGLLALAFGFSGPLWADDVTTRPVSDKQLEHQVHSAIVADPNLPYCSHIVQVESSNGKVTLQGRADTEAQKEQIGQHASEIAGDDNVNNQVTVREQ